MAQKRISDLDAAAALNGGELFEVSQQSAAVTITVNTISASAADNSLNDTGNGFTAAGFVAGDRVTVKGFATGANNLFVGILTAVAPDKLTFGGADGDALANEAAGANVTVSKWVSRRTTPKDIVALVGAVPSAVKVEAANYAVVAADASKYIRLTAGVAKAITIDVEGGTPLPTNAEWHIRNVGLGVATITPANGVLVNVPSGGTLGVPPGGTVTLKRVGANEFDLLGQTVAA